MRFVIVTQTVDEFTAPVGEESVYTQLPTDYPVNVMEADYDSLSIAQAANPGRSVYDVAAYNTLMQTLTAQNQDTLDLLVEVDPIAPGTGA